jgi:hypothetical protein
MPNFRTKVRKSLLALVVSYLREQIIDTTKFTYVDGIGGSYPHFDEVFTFPLGPDTFQIIQKEFSQPYLPFGVTLQFSDDIPDTSKSMPQQYSVKVQFMIRMPFNIRGESFCQQIAREIDQALYRANGKCSIKDYDVNPATDTGVSIEWQTVPRGDWKFDDKPISPGTEVLNLDAEMVYFIPKSEW